MDGDYLDQTTFVTGISEDKLKNFILELYDYRDKITEILNTVKDLADSTSEYYESDAGDEFRNKFRNFSTNFDVIISMLKGYCDKFESVLTEYKNNTELNAEYLRLQSSKVEEDTEKVEES